VPLAYRNIENGKILSTIADIADTCKEKVENLVSLRIEIAQYYKKNGYLP